MSQPTEHQNFPDKAKFSVSELSQYALCPYRYFARYQLGLEDRELSSPWGLPRKKLGELTHRILELKLKGALAGEEISSTDLDAIAKEYFPEGFKGAFQNLQWQQTKQSLLKTIASEVEFLKKHQLQPYQTEKSLALKLSVPSIKQDHLITIHCRVDRVDMITDKEERALLVVDYKTSSGAIGPKQRQNIYQLISPQLPIYMLALKHESGMEIVGGMEVRVRSQNRGGVVVDSEKQRFTSRLFDKYAEDEFLNHFERELKKQLQLLLNHEYAPAPKDPDKCGLGNCPYWGLCRYDLPR